MTLRRTFLACLFSGLPAAATGSVDGSPDSLVDQLRAAAVAVASPSELDPLFVRIGSDVRLVLLGESTHGTHEFYTWRDAISRRLIADHDFSFIAVEGDWAACAELDRYVRDLPGAGGSAREILMGFDRWPLWMWANEEVVELVEWLRGHNDKRPREKRVGFFGIDVYGMERSIAKTPRLLREVDEGLAQRAADAYACFGDHADDPRGYVQRVAMRGASCEDAVRGIVAMIREARSANEDADADEHLFRAKQSALVVKHAERHFRSGLFSQAASWNARAEHFFLTAERLLEHFGENSRGIVWAHNTHIGDARATPMRQAGMVTIGQLAREGLGRENVVLIGFATHRGEAVAGRTWGARPERLPQPPAARGSIEDALHGLGGGNRLVLMGDLAEAEALQRPISHRAIGVTYDPARERTANYVPSLLLERYDALIFIEETRPLTPLHETAAE